MAANEHRGEVEIALPKPDGSGDHLFIMRPDFNAIAAIERECDRAVMELLHDGMSQRMRTSHAESVIYNGIAAVDPRADRIKLRKMIMAAGMSRIVGPVTAFCLHALDGGEPAKPKVTDDPAGEA